MDEMHKQYELKRQEHVAKSKDLIDNYFNSLMKDIEDLEHNLKLLGDL